MIPESRIYRRVSKFPRIYAVLGQQPRLILLIIWSREVRRIPNARHNCTLHSAGLRDNPSFLSFAESHSQNGQCSRMDPSSYFSLETNDGLIWRYLPSSPYSLSDVRILGTSSIPYDICHPKLAIRPVQH